MAKAKMKFADALEQLEKIVAEIEGGKVSLEESIEKYAQGIELIKQCQAILDTAEKKIKLLTEGEDGKATQAGQLQDEQQN